NSTRQQERNNSTPLGNRNETAQFASVGTKQLNSATAATTYNRLQPPSTAYNRRNRLHRRTAFTAETAFSTY
ncbi:hypothetical protein TNCV_4899791, partial [Trichonephila clavipes]